MEYHEKSFGNKSKPSGHFFGGKGGSNGNHVLILEEGKGAKMLVSSRF